MDTKIALLITIIGLLFIIGEGRSPVLHRVGGSKFGWRPNNVNLSNWSSNEQFFVGDWLYFGFDKTQVNVLEVNETGFENCIETDFKTNITRGGRDVFNLTEVRPYYFISGRGYCFNGVKLAINVQDLPLDSHIKSSNTSTTSSASSSSSATTSIIMGPFLVAIAFLSLIFH